MTTPLPQGEVAVRERSRSCDRAPATAAVVPAEAPTAAEVPQGEAAVRERSRSRDRAPATAAVVPAEAPTAVEEPWYQVKGMLHLGMGLRLGGVYKLSELQRRCNGSAAKLKSLQDCTRDPGLLQQTAAPPSPVPYQLPLRRSSSGQESRARRSPYGLIKGQVVWHDRPGGRTRLARVITVSGAADQPYNIKTYSIKYLDRATSSAAGGADAAGGEEDGLLFNVAAQELRAMAVHEVSMAQTMLAPFRPTSVPAALVSASSSCRAQPGEKASHERVESSPVATASPDSSVEVPAAASAPETKRSFLGYGNTQPATALLPKPRQPAQPSQPGGPTVSKVSTAETTPGHALAIESGSCSSKGKSVDSSLGDTNTGTAVSSGTVASLLLPAPAESQSAGPAAVNTAHSDASHSRAIEPVTPRRPCSGASFKVGQVVWHVGRQQLPPWPAHVVEIDVLSTGPMYWVKHFGHSSTGGPEKFRVDAASLVSFSPGDGSVGDQLAKAAHEAEQELGKQLQVGESTSQGTGQATNQRP